MLDDDGSALTRDLIEESRDAWKRLRQTASGFGEHRIYASGTAIMFSSKPCYFFVRPKVKYLEVCIFLGRRLEDGRVHSVRQASKTKLAHMVRITHRDEVESPVTDWLLEAYDVSDTLSKGGAAAKRGGPVKQKGTEG